MIGTIVSAALWALVASLLLSMLVGALVAGLIAFARPAAATRQALWSIALVAAGFAPVAILAVMLVRGAIGGATADVMPMPNGHAAQAHLTAAGRAPVRDGASEAAAPAVLRVPGPPDLAPIVARAIVGVWALGALIGLIGLGRSLARVRGLKGRSSPLDGTLATELPWLTTTAGREIYLRLSYETETPIAVGFRRPVILLPTEMATADGLTSIEPLIMHEYAHLARYDDWSNLAQRATERVFWFNPLVWILGQRIALEREVAADEAVVARTHDAKRYASTLWRMAQEMRMPEHVVVAPGAMLTRKQISVRIERLLDDSPIGRRHIGAAALGLGILAATGVAGLAAGAPPITLAQSDAPAVHAVPPVAPNPVPVPSVAALPVLPSMPAHIVVNADPSDAQNMGQKIAADVRRNVSDALSRRGTIVAADTSGPLTRDLVGRCIGCDFTGRDLSGIDLSNLSLTGDDFTRANLTAANFSHSTMQGLDFNHAILNHADFHKSKLTGVDFNHAILDGADLSNAVLTGVDLGHASLTGANESGIRLFGSSLP
jgi:beta-lactamase regulating signal transducer with metallopeptidase domain